MTDHDIPEAWKDALRACELFVGLDANLLLAVGGGLREVERAAGETLVRQGDEGDSLFVVVEGTLEVLLEEGESTMRLHDLWPGDVVGEIALLLGGQRSATVRASTPTRALELSQEGFAELIERAPELMRTFTANLQDRMRRVRGVGYLTEIFGSLEPEALRELEGELSWKHLRGGEELFGQGAEPDGAYILVGGRLRVVVSDAGGVERVLDDVRPGQWVGEMALLTRSQRSATVYALRDSQLVWLSQEAFDRLVVRHPTAMLQTTRLLVERMQRLIGGARRPRAGVRTFALVPAHPGIDLDPVAEQVRRALSRHGSTLHLRAARVDEALGKPGIA
ncbi:MAG: cyclic nucleotide-binding domain-containing protein, partial [Myxococcales bacterium]|nr:cyclic nucleotide-binding domain-containing protein [Myxococcales bacterium]